MAGPAWKPFVVCSLNTKRYAPRIKVPVEKPHRISGPMTALDRSSTPRLALTNKVRRPRLLPTVIPKANPRRPSTQPVDISTNGTTGEKESPSLSPAAYSDSSAPLKTFVTQPLRIVKKRKDGETMDRFLSPVMPTQPASASEGVLRSCCAARSRVSRACVGPATISEGEQDATAKDTRHVKTTSSIIKEPAVFGECRPRAPTRNQGPTLSNLVVHPVTECSLPSSPSMSSFPGQGKRVAVDVHVKRTKTTTTTSDDETASSISDALASGILGIHDSSGTIGSDSPSSLRSSALTLVATPPTPAKTLAGINDTVSVGNSMQEDPFVELSKSACPGTMGRVGTWKMRTLSLSLSPEVCAATVTSLPVHGTPPMTSLARMMVKNQAKPPRAAVHTGNSTRMAARHAICLAQNLLPSRRALQSVTATASKTMATGVMQIQRLLFLPLDKKGKTSKDLTAHMEMQVLGPRQTAGGEARTPCLDAFVSRPSSGCLGDRGCGAGQV